MSAALETNTKETENHSSTEKSTLRGKENTQVKLSELKVIDLKYQLESRDLDKTGVKSALIERLKNALKEEGKDPEEHLFEIAVDSSAKCNTLKKNVILSDGNDNSDLIQEEESTNEEALQLSVEDEEAQFNEEESMDVSSKSNEVENAESKTNSENLESSSELVAKDSSILLSEKIVENVIVVEKAANSDETEDKIDTPENQSEKVTTPSKSIPSETAVVPSVLTPKVSKIVGKTDKKHVPLTAKSLCVTGLANTTRAADLKALFTKQGRVLSVKIVKSAKQVPGKCYGFVTMANSKDASKAIQNLHRTELNGRIISVERTQTDTNALLKKSDSKLATLAIKKQTAGKTVIASKAITENNKSPSSALEIKESKHDSGKAKEPAKETKIKTSSKTDGVKDDKTTDKSKGKDEADKNKVKEKKTRESQDHKDSRSQRFRRPLNTHSRPFSFHDRSRYGSFRRPFGRPSYSTRSFRPIAASSSYRMRSSFPIERIREDRLHSRLHLRLESDRRSIDMSRSRFAERLEIDRERDDELFRHRMVERKQREEALRLEREKERLRLERELLERERAEILRMEREKQRLERERIEREREELRRQAELRLSNKRPFSRVDRDSEPFWDGRKRSVPRYEARSTFPADLPSVPRFELSQRERPTYNRNDLGRPDRYNNQKSLDRPDRYNSQKSLDRPDRFNSQKPVDRPDRFNSQKTVDRPDRFSSQKTLDRPDRFNSQKSVDRPDRYSNQKSLDRPDRFSSQKPVEAVPRSSFGDRETRREVTIRSRDDRQIFDRSEFRDSRRGFTSRERAERHPVARRESPREDWKHERRVHERIVTPSSSSGQRRLNYY